MRPGPGVIGGQPRLNLILPQNVSLTFDVNLFWRQSLSDGVYNPAGFPVRAAGASRDRYIGAQPEIDVFWQASRRVSFDVQFSRFFIGKFLREAPTGGRNLNYLAAYANYKF